MVGAVIIIHSFIGRELMDIAEYLLGKIDGIVWVSMDMKMNALTARKIISGAIQKVDQGDGVLLLTDLFGYSPSNLAFPFLIRGKIEVLTGVTLPMILTFSNYRKDRNLKDLAKLLQLSGRRNKVRAKEVGEREVDFWKPPIKKKQVFQKNRVDFFP